MADVAEDGPFTNAAAAISQGKRHLLVRDYTAAVTAFAEGLELLSKKHGDCGDELGEPYLLYGRALLGLAREEAGVLGGGVLGSEGAEETEDVDEDIDDEEVDDDKLSNIDEKEGDENEDDNAHDLNKTDDKKIAEQNTNEDEASKPVENTAESAPGSSKEEVINNGKGPSDGKNRDNIPSGSGGDNDNDEGEVEGEDVNKEEDEDDPGRGIDLQVAWEVLELAKIVFFKRGKSGYKNLAEAYRLLGEVAMESGNHQVAVSDLGQALKILENVEPYESRSIAELHYQLGLAHSLLNDFDASIEQFNEATNLLEARIKELEKTKEPPKSDDPFYTIEGEIKELKELLPEIQEKIVDMKDFKQEACRLVIEGIKSKVAGSCANGAGPSTEPTSSTTPSTADDAVSPKQIKPASDISHLVRKKRKPEETQVENASPCKKPTP